MAAGYPLAAAAGPGDVAGPAYTAVPTADWPGVPAAVPAAHTRMRSPNSSITGRSSACPVSTANTSNRASINRDITLAGWLHRPVSTRTATASLSRQGIEAFGCGDPAA